MSNLKVSVIIPTYNYGNFISEAIDSVICQTYKNIEVIVVDDGSTDNTQEILDKYKTTIKVIHQQNKGVSAARNNGAENSQGELIAFLDADDIWLPTKIEQQVNCLLNDLGQIGLVHCGIQEIDLKGNCLDEIVNGKEGWLADELLLLRPAIIGPGTTLLIKREIFDEVSGFDERRELKAAEDWEFCYRIAKVCKVGFVPEVLAYYRNHGDNRHLKLSNFESSVSLIYREIFANTDEFTLKLRYQVYGNFYKTLAGSHFQSKSYFGFIKNTIKAVYYSPSILRHYLTFPKRLLKRGVVRYNWNRK